MKVVPIQANAALVVGNDGLADAVHELAEMIRSGEIDAKRVCLVYMGHTKVAYRFRGPPTTKAKIIGMLEYAKGQVMGYVATEEDDEEDEDA